MTVQMFGIPSRMRQAFVPYSTMLKTLGLSLLLATFLGVGASAQTNWKLVWSDEFNGPQGASPDPSKWVFENGPGSNFNPDEIETVCPPGSNTDPCSASNPNIFLDGNGNLVIQAINTNGTWTSARMKTAGIAQEQFQYGRIEARMKLPVGDGLWPAFWMLGSDLCAVPPVQWPQCGEQDIMEWVQSYGPTQTSSTIHGPGYSGDKGVSHIWTPFPNGGRTDDAGYHIYGVIWSQDQIQFYRDDYTSPLVPLTPASVTPNQWVFNQQFFLILDLAIGGGGFPGFTDSSTSSTATMLVDYVRVFTADSGGIDSSAWYNVVNQNSNACVDATNFGTTNGTAVQQWACGSQQQNQEWQFQPTDSGYYKIVSRAAPAEVWDVTNLGTTNGTPIQLWQFGGGTNQEWEPISLGNGIFEFVDRAASGRCLDVPGASTANGARLQIYDCNGTSAQAWTLIQQP